MKVQHVINFVRRILKNIFDGRDNPDFPISKLLEIVNFGVLSSFPHCVQFNSALFAITF